MTDYEMAQQLMKEFGSEELANKAVDMIIKYSLCYTDNKYFIQEKNFWDNVKFQIEEINS